MIGQELPTILHILLAVAFLTLSYFPNDFLCIPACWLAEPDNSFLLYTITYKLNSPGQSVMSSNQLEHTVHHEWLKYMASYHEAAP